MVYKNSLLLPLRKRSKNASIFLNNWLLKVVSATFWPITMFKGQSLLFHVVSETLITQNYLFVIPNNVVRFTCLYRSCHILRQKMIEANTILKSNIIAGIILMTYAKALTPTGFY